MAAGQGTQSDLGLPGQGVVLAAWSGLDGAARPEHSWLDAAAGDAAHGMTAGAIGERGPLAALLGAALLVLGLGIAAPVASLLSMSFYAADGSFAGLANFSAHLADLWAAGYRHRLGAVDAAARLTDYVDGLGHQRRPLA